MKKNNHLSRDLARERHLSLDRRKFLRGLGALVALPAFKSLLPSRLYGAVTTADGILPVTATGAPKRMAFLYIPNGTIPGAWWPTGNERDFQLNRTMKPLEPLKDKIQIISGLECENATPGPDGAGDHARASGSFLTGVRVRKTAGADIHAGTSIDQVAARHIGHLTRFPSLELACDAIRRSGNCDSGYSCAYEYNLAWRSPTQPMTPEYNPRLLFERLFGSGNSPEERIQNIKRRQTRQKSILDFVLEDTRSLERSMASKDKLKLDEYLTSVRELEQRIERVEQFKGTSSIPDEDTPPGIPENYEEHIQLMFDMMLLAFQTDSTRVATMLIAREGSQRTFPDYGIPEGHHYCTHHRNRRELIEKVEWIDHFYVRQLARFLQKMDQTQDVDGNSLLHNSMILYGSGNADGNRHTHDNLPIILAGNGGGHLTTGRYSRLCPTPITNLYLSMIEQLGVQNVARFGDSTERLANI